MGKEIFKRIPGFKDYSISNLGNIISKKRGRLRFLKLGINGEGYKLINLCRNNIIFSKNIATLLLTVFIGPCPEGMEYHHLNGNKLDNQLKNLKWEDRGVYRYKHIHGYIVE